MNMASFLPLAWDLGTLLTNTTSRAKEWGSLLIVLCGVVLIIVGIVFLVKAIVGGQRSSTSIPRAVIMIFIGGALAVGGYSWVAGIAEGGKDTIDDLGRTTIIPWLSTFLP